MNPSRPTSYVPRSNKIFCASCAPRIYRQYQESNGFIGGYNYNFSRFCEELYIVLYTERDGINDTSYLLKELFLRSGIDGAEVARRNGFDAFELFLKAPILGDVVGYELSGGDFSFHYYARLGKKYEHLRKNIIPRRRAFGRTERI